MKQPLPIRHTPNSKTITDLFFTAEALGETFDDVYIITLKGHFYDKVLEEALRRYTTTDKSKMLGWASEDIQIKTHIQNIINNKQVSVNGFVEVTKRAGYTPITVCLPADQIDDIAIFEATKRVYRALKALNGKSGTIMFEKQIQYNIKDLPWLNAH